MSNAKVTSLEVAQRAGVSQSAVSRVFTPGASASQKTIDKVRKAAQELGYRPNVLARSLTTGKSRIIGLVVAYLENQFYPEVLERLSNALQRRGYHVLIFMASQTAENIDSVMQEILDYQVDGIILASVALSSDLAAACRMAQVPVILFNRGQDDGEVSAVTSANVLGGRKVADFLLAGGHDRIAHIAGWSGSSTGRDRARGFTEALASKGLAPLAIIDGKYTRAGAQTATHTLMQGPMPPDAIFVGNDHMAFAVMDTLMAHYPDAAHGISIVGYDDVPMAAWQAYNLTTLRQPVNRMVEKTVSTLMAQIEGGTIAPETIEIEGELIVRTSARIPKGWKK